MVARNEIVSIGWPANVRPQIWPRSTRGAAVAAGVGLAGGELGGSSAFVSAGDDGHLTG